MSDLDLVREKIPTLNEFGANGLGEPLTEANLPSIDRARRWLRDNVAPTRTINRRHTSYGLKHLAEERIGYLTNGEFIAAALLEGYPHRLTDGPNVCFGMSERSLREVRA